MIGWVSHTRSTTILSYLSICLPHGTRSHKWSSALFFFCLSPPLTPAGLRRGMKRNQKRRRAGRQKHAWPRHHVRAALAQGEAAPRAGEDDARGHAAARAGQQRVGAASQGERGGLAQPLEHEAPAVRRARPAAQPRGGVRAGARGVEERRAPPAAHPPAAPRLRVPQGRLASLLQPASKTAARRARDRQVARGEPRRALHPATRLRDAAARPQLRHHAARVRTARAARGAAAADGGGAAVLRSLHVHRVAVLRRGVRRLRLPQGPAHQAQAGRRRLPSPALRALLPTLPQARLRRSTAQHGPLGSARF